MTMKDLQDLYVLDVLDDKRKGASRKVIKEGGIKIFKTAIQSGYSFETAFKIANAITDITPKDVEMVLNEEIKKKVRKEDSVKIFKVAIKMGLSFEDAFKLANKIYELSEQETNDILKDMSSQN